MTYFDKSLEFMRNTVAEAPHDLHAELMLRNFVATAADKAPIEELVKIGQVMIENLESHRRKHAGNN